MTGLTDKPERSSVSILGMRVDPTFTVANLIQICLIVFGLLNGTYLLYFGLKGQFAAVDVAQAAIVKQQDALAAEIDQIQAERRQRSERVDTIISSIDKRVSAQETASAVSNATAATMSSRISELLTKVDNLDTFVRTNTVRQ